MKTSKPHFVEYIEMPLKVLVVRSVEFAVWIRVDSVGMISNNLKQTRQTLVLGFTDIITKLAGQRFWDGLLIYILLSYGLRFKVVLWRETQRLFNTIPISKTHSNPNMPAPVNVNK